MCSDSDGGGYGGEEGEAENQVVAEGEPLIFYKTDETILIKSVSHIADRVSYNVIYTASL